MTDDLDNYYKSYDYGARTPVYINESELTEKQKHQLMYSDKFCIRRIANHLSASLVLCRKDGLYLNRVGQSPQRMAHRLNHCQCKSRKHEYVI